MPITPWGLARGGSRPLGVPCGRSGEGSGPGVARRMGLSVRQVPRVLAALQGHTLTLLHRAMDTLIMPAWHPGYPNLRSYPQARWWRDGKEHAMGWLDPDELRQVLPAETSAFPSPIPTQSVSSDEFMPAPDGEAAGIRGAPQAVRRRAGVPARYAAACLFQNRGRDGRGLCRHE